MEFGLVSMKSNQPCFVSATATALLSSTLVWTTTIFAEQEEVLDAMQTEVNRAFEALQEQTEPPYYISYEITHESSISVNGGFGAILDFDESETSQLDIDLRIGDYQLDNTRSVGMGGFGLGLGGMMMEATGIPTVDSEALKTLLWRQTDAAYKSAVQAFTSVKNAVQSQVEQEDKSGDFSAAPVEEYVESQIDLVADSDLFKNKIAEYTKPFADVEYIVDNNSSVSGRVETNWFVNTEGTRIKQSRPFFRLIINATSKADDGMVLSKTLTYEANSQEELFDDAQVMTDVERLIVDLKALKDAPLVEPYTGPAILSGRASGVFFHEILGHRLESHRNKDVMEGQTFKAYVGEQVLPTNFSVIFDPTVDKFGDHQLIGDYEFDNQGVKGRRVVIIENGTLKRFLTTRAPIAGFPESNGHGRKEPGNTVVSRQSNMFVEVEDPVSYDELMELFIARMAEQDKPFGLIFDDIQGGFTTTGRFMPNAFNVSPVLVYRVYTDGTKEVVRGVDLIGTPLTTFSRIEQGADDFEVFNGMCGAESGWVPVSTISPSILVSMIEVQKAFASTDIPPILPSPVTTPPDQSIRQN